MGVAGREATIIVFKNKPGTPNKELKRFCNLLFGYIDRSNKGGYTYPRPGILGEIPHIHIDKVRNVIITRTKDAPKILELLDQFDAYTFSRRVILDQEDWSKFAVKKPSTEGKGSRGAEAQNQEDQ